MKIAVATLFLTATVAAQTVGMVTGTAATLGGSSPGANSSSSSRSSGSSAANSSSPSSAPIVTGNSTTFAEIHDDQKAKKPLVVPDSLQGGGDASMGLNATVNQQHADAVKPVGLHFDNLVDGTDPVSVTVRHFQIFCNGHNMAQDEIEVRNWVKANQNIVASTPSEMQRKQQYPLIREQLIGMKFPKDWFEVQASAAAATSTSK